MILKIGFSFLKLDQTSFVGVDKQVYFWTRQMFLFGFIYLYVVLMRPINLWVNGDTHEQKMLNWMIVSCVIFWQKNKTYSKYFYDLFIFSNDGQLFICMICNCKNVIPNLSSPWPKILQRKYTFIYPPLFITSRLTLLTENIDSIHFLNNRFKTFLVY